MTTKQKKKLDFSTAKVADGAVKAPKSVYEICGIPTHRYKYSTLADYKKYVGNLDLIGLQDEAYTVGIGAFGSRQTLIDRLENKFLLETSRFSMPQTATQSQSEDKDIQSNALKILSRGR